LLFQNNTSSSNFNSNNNLLSTNIINSNSHINSNVALNKSSSSSASSGGVGVEQILKEMTSISSHALLPEIAATPRKEMESKFALNQMNMPSKHKYVTLPPVFSMNNKPSE
jgi:hypothetical protein